jgi:hypothetical protein
MAKKAANRVVESNNSNKVFELGKYYHLTPFTIECDLNQGYVPGELEYNYTVTTDEGIVETYANMEVELDCSQVWREEVRLLDVYVTLKDGDDEVASSMTITYNCIPTNREVTYCIKPETVQVSYATKDGKHWVKEGKVPLTGGKVLVSFGYTKYVKDASGETTSDGGHDEIIDIPPCNCGEDPDCGGTLVGEIEYKQPHEEDCNIVVYTVEQEKCVKDENK